jgi:hypothetical protein
MLAFSVRFLYEKKHLPIMMVSVCWFGGNGRRDESDG